MGEMNIGETVKSEGSSFGESQLYDGFQSPVVLGSKRGSRHKSLSNLLESRQVNGTCSQPGYVLVCPSTEQDPCCAPGYPICCHDPSDNCCPEGSFCQGISTCCRLGSTGCGEGCCAAGIPCCDGVCCPSAAFVCDIGGTKPTCINTYNNATSLPSSTRTSSQTGTSISFQSPSQDSSHGENNTPLIAGAAAGGAVALILIGLLAFCIVRKKPMREKVHKVKSVPRPSGRHSPLLTGPATPAPLLHNPEHANRYSSTLYNTPSYTMNTSATPSNSVLPLHRPGPPSTYDSATSEALMSQTNPSNLPYSPSVETSSLSPGISGRGANYYASTPIPHLGGTSISYSQTSPQTELGRTGSLAYGTQYGASTEAHLPWLQQETLSSSSSGTDSQPQRFVVSPPPPPFTPAPDPNMVPVWAQSQGRVISATAPGDRKARPSGQS